MRTDPDCSVECGEDLHHPHGRLSGAGKRMSDQSAVYGGTQLGVASSSRGIYGRFSFADPVTGEGVWTFGGMDIKWA